MLHQRPFSLLLVASLSCVSACTLKKRDDFLKIPIEDVIDHHLLKELGYDTPALPERFIDPNLQGLISEFIETARKNAQPVSQAAIERLRIVKYVDVLSMGEAPGVLAACNRYFLNRLTIGGDKLAIDYTTIEVLKNADENYVRGSQLRLRKLVFHEAFHCFYDKGHLPDKVPGIMNAHFRAYDYSPYSSWDQDITNMFSKSYMDMIPNTN